MELNVPSEELSQELRKPECVITKLDHHNMVMNDQYIAIIADALKYNTSVTSVTVSDTYIKSKGLSLLIEALEINKTIRSFSMINTYFSSDTATCLARVLCENRSLRHLNISRYCILEDECWLQISSALKSNETLTSLTIGKSIGHPAVEHLFSVLETSNISIEILTIQCGRMLCREDKQRAEKFTTRNIVIGKQIRRVIYLILCISKRRNEPGMGSFGILPEKGLFLKIAQYVWATRRQLEWLKIIK